MSGEKVERAVWERSRESGVEKEQCGKGRSGVVKKMVRGKDEKGKSR